MQLTLDKHLEQEQQALVERVSAHREQVDTLSRRIGEIPSALVDTADPTAREELVQELSALEQQRTVVMLELGELKRRERIAYVAIYEAAEEQARLQYERAVEEAREAYRKAKEVTQKHRSAINGGVPEEMWGDFKAIDLYIAELAGKKETLWALSKYAKRDQDRAKGLWEQAQQALKAARGEGENIVQFLGRPAA